MPTWGQRENSRADQRRRAGWPRRRTHTAESLRTRRRSIPGHLVPDPVVTKRLYGRFVGFFHKHLGKPKAGK